MKAIELVCVNEVGLHARPAALFVKTAARFKSKIQVRNLTRTSAWVDAKSILKVLTIGVGQNHAIEISADGVDELEALNALEALVQSNFA